MKLSFHSVYLGYKLGRLLHWGAAWTGGKYVESCWSWNVWGKSQLRLRQLWTRKQAVNSTSWGHRDQLWSPFKVTDGERWCLCLKPVLLWDRPLFPLLFITWCFCSFLAPLLWMHSCSHVALIVCSEQSWIFRLFQPRSEQHRPEHAGSSHLDRS